MLQPFHFVYVAARRFRPQEPRTAQLGLTLAVTLGLFGLTIPTNFLNNAISRRSYHFSDLSSRCAVNVHRFPRASSSNSSSDAPCPPPLRAPCPAPRSLDFC